jgi:hypothetical protein
VGGPPPPQEHPLPQIHFFECSHIGPPPPGNTPFFKFISSNIFESHNGPSPLPQHPLLKIHVFKFLGHVRAPSFRQDTPFFKFFKSSDRRRIVYRTIVTQTATIGGSRKNSQRLRVEVGTADNRLDRRSIIGAKFGTYKSCRVLSRPARRPGPAGFRLE